MGFSNLILALTILTTCWCDVTLGDELEEQMTEGGCFRIRRNCMIINAQPFYRISLVNTQACMQECANRGVPGIKFVCRSFVYDTQNKICDLFAHTASQFPARLHPMLGRDYYESTGVCALNDSPKSSVRAKPVPNTVKCADNEVERFLQIPGFELADHDDVAFKDRSLEDCVNICIHNQDTDGTTANCRSFDYFARTRECRITEERMIPDGDGQLQPSPGNSYFQKICIASNIAKLCSGQLYMRDPQKILVGFAETVVTVGTFDECLTACLDGQSRFGFDCASGMFYFDESSDGGNCILNEQTKDRHPSLYGDEDEEQVDYFQIDCEDRLTSRQRFGNLAIQKASSLSDIDRNLENLSQTKRPNGLSPGIVSPPRSLVFPEQSQFGTRQIDSSSRESPRPFNPNIREFSTNQHLPKFGQWSDWSPCDRQNEGRRVRYRVCGRVDIRQCPVESRWCNEDPTTSALNDTGSTNFDPGQQPQSPINVAVPRGTNAVSLTESLDAIKSLIAPDCVQGLCCKFDNSCRIGIVKLGEDKYQWCTNPCGGP